MASVVSRGRGRRRSMNEINMVPFIDVMLVLLIIFMVTAPLISPSVIDVPSVGKAATAPDRVITIEITKDSKLTIRSRSTGKGPSTDSTLAATLENVALQTLPLIGEARDTPVVISADRNVKYENVVKVMDTLQRAGIARVGLSVQLAP